LFNCLTLSEASPDKGELWLAQATEIFFQTAKTKTLASAEDKSAFLRRWFGNYWRSQPGAFLLAIDEGEAIGYLAGSLDSFAGVSRAIIGDIDYFTSEFCAALQAYPSHFHINVRPEYQSRGVGRGLVARFSELCRSAGSPGMHIATGEMSSAVKFYESCGFQRLTPFHAASPALAVMVRPLAGCISC
jgi:GNAT superfamily N-acetyltransferase